jgi:hypothetical protein
MAKIAKTNASEYGNNPGLINATIALIDLMYVLISIMRTRIFGEESQVVTLGPADQLINADAKDAPSSHARQIRLLRCPHPMVFRYGSSFYYQTRWVFKRIIGFRAENIGGTLVIQPQP